MSLAIFAGSGVVMLLKAPPASMLHKARKPPPLSEIMVGGMYRETRNKIRGTKSSI
jgi:hypothetical protein